MVARLTRALAFPPPESATPEGIVAIGGDTRPERLLLAYSQGIFPWPHADLPLLWFSPDPRCVILFEHAHIGRSLRKQVRSSALEVRADTNFTAVIDACAGVPRPGQDGTWINEEIREGYCALYEQGFAHSIEVYRMGRLVGGLYGVSVGASFCGESMFALETDASKIATVSLLGNLAHLDFHFVDCQVRNDHLTRFGAIDWPRETFLHALRRAVAEPTRRGPWHLELDPQAALAALDARRAG
jgi:leucyl/phenylalanyl-tRNA--protein transferase